ncbi:unnamed protein product [Paramecium primaurelia]|uniref:Tetratricopeptide repeat protein n=1 Tax=Paramecium primaurelia TaxID=5886 RepID=A0A8S1MZF3_PARPR|nr:unnamed protein product [Paramecium primaurelia]
MIQAENFLLQKYYNQAINLYQKALQHLQLIENNNTLREVSLIKAQLYYQFGRIYFKLKQDSQETQKCFDVAIKIWQEKLKNIESIEMANFQYNIGLVFKQMKRYDESLKALENADQQKKKIIGEEKNEQFAVISYQKGLIMIEMKKIDQAEQELIKAQNIMQISNNFKLKSKIDLQLALINEQKGLKFEFIKALEELISKKRNHYAYIHPSINNDILSLADAYEKMFKDTAKQTELYQLIYFITILHESQIQCYQQKNPITDQIEQAKFQANYKQINANWLRKNNSLTIIKRFQPNFFELDLQRTLILRSGIITKEEFEIKQILQTSTLNYIRQYTFEGKWERSILSGFTLYGVENYINKKHLNNQLRGELNKNQNLKIALMLCFEAINIGIVQSNFEYISFANRFITKIIRYQQMQNFLGDVIQLHPEYFIDGKILKSLVNDNTILQENLGNEEKKISSNKIISDIIFNMC